MGEKLKTPPLQLTILLVTVAWIFGMDFAPSGIRSGFLIFLQLEHLFFSTNNPNIALLVAKHIAALSTLLALYIPSVFWKSNKNILLSYQNLVAYLRFRGKKITSGKQILFHVLLICFFGSSGGLISDYFMFNAMSGSSSISDRQLAQSDCIVLFLYLMFGHFIVVLPYAIKNRNSAL